MKPERSSSSLDQAEALGSLDQAVRAADFRPRGPFSEKELGLLRGVMEVFHALDLVAWLDQGSLLGVIRDEMLLSWDHDVDLGAWREDIEAREAELAAALRSSLTGKASIVWGHRTIGVNPLEEGAYLPVNIGLYEREGDRAVKWFGRPPAGIPILQSAT